MRNTFTFKMHSGSSSICKELTEKTRTRKIDWVSCESFIDYLELQGIAFDDIKWFHSYLKHIQAVRHFPILSDTYFTLFEDRLFAISQSKYSREIRLDFTSSFGGNSVWRGVIDSQATFSKLHSFVEITNHEDSEEECKELLYSTGCIHA